MSQASGPLGLLCLVMLPVLAFVTLGLWVLVRTDRGGDWNG